MRSIQESEFGADVYGTVETHQPQESTQGLLQVWKQAGWTAGASPARDSGGASTGAKGNLVARSFRDLDFAALEVALAQGPEVVITNCLTDGRRLSGSSIAKWRHLAAILATLHVPWVMLGDHNAEPEELRRGGAAPDAGRRRAVPAVVERLYHLLRRQGAAFWTSALPRAPSSP